MVFKQEQHEKKQQRESISTSFIDNNDDNNRYEYHDVSFISQNERGDESFIDGY